MKQKDKLTLLEHTSGDAMFTAYFECFKINELKEHPFSAYQIQEHVINGYTTAKGYKQRLRALYNYAMQRYENNKDLTKKLQWYTVALDVYGCQLDLLDLETQAVRNRIQNGVSLD